MFGQRQPVPRPILAHFAPQPDITAYELSRIFQNVTPGVGAGGLGSNGGVTFTPGQWEELPADIKRHFST